jgi:cytosine/adenosine deaminase-related metal-dependent hydrolase
MAVREGVDVRHVVRDGGEGAQSCRRRRSSLRGGGRRGDSYALVSANALGAEALGMADRIGSIAPGLEADIIALDGDPLNDIAAVRRVVFVMKGGIVQKNDYASHQPARGRTRRD